MPTISSRTALAWDGIASGHKMVVDDNTANVTKSLDYTELKKLVGTIPVPNSDATLTIVYPGRYIHTGTGATWTLPAGSTALDGLPFTWAHTGASGSLIINDSTGAHVATLLAGVKKDAFWNNTSSTWIYY